MRIILTISFLLFAAALCAQQQPMDTIANKEESETVVGKIREKLNDIRPFSGRDTVKTVSSQATDSLDTVVKTGIDSVNTLGTIVTQKLDTINNIGDFGDKVEQWVDSVGQKAISHLDTIESKLKGIKTSALHTPRDRAGQLIDSVTTVVASPVDSLNRVLLKTEDKIAGIADSLEQRVSNQIDKTEEKINAKVEELTGEGVSIPGMESPELKRVNLNKAALPPVESPLQDIMEDTDISTEVPALDELAIEVPELEDAGIVKSIDVPQTDRLPELPDVNEIEKVNEITDKLDKTDGKLAELEQTENDIRSAATGGEELDKQLDGQLKQVSQVKAVDGEVKKVTSEQVKYAEMVQRYRDKKLLEEEIRRKAQNVANEHLNQHSAAFKETQSQLAQLKKKYDEVKSIHDLPRRRMNAMRGKSLEERLVPGVTVQLYNNSTFMVDAGVQLGYRISGKIMAGVGGIYRVGISDEYEYLVRSMRVMGIRTFANWTFRKGFFLHGEGEFLFINQDAPSSQQPVVEVADDHVLSVYGGLGKRFNVSKRIKGSVLGLYRIEVDGYLPSYSKLNVRLGFDYNIGNRHKKRKF